MTDPMTYEGLRKAFEKGLEPWPEHPLVVHPNLMAELERLGIVENGRLDRATLNAYRREHGI